MSHVVKTPTKEIWGGLFCLGLLALTAAQPTSAAVLFAPDLNIQDEAIVYVSPGETLSLNVVASNIYAEDGDPDVLARAVNLPDGAAFAELESGASESVYALSWTPLGADEQVTLSIEASFDDAQHANLTTVHEVTLKAGAPDDLSWMEQPADVNLPVGLQLAADHFIGVRDDVENADAMYMLTWSTQPDDCVWLRIEQSEGDSIDPSPRAWVQVNTELAAEHEGSTCTVVANTWQRRSLEAGASTLDVVQHVHSITLTNTNPSLPVWVRPSANETLTFREGEHAEVTFEFTDETAGNPSAWLRCDGFPDEAGEAGAYNIELLGPQTYITSLNWTVTGDGVGEHHVQCTATNDAGNEAVLDFVVDIVPNVKPSITLTDTPEIRECDPQASSADLYRSGSAEAVAFLVEPGGPSRIYFFLNDPDESVLNIRVDVEFTDDTSRELFAVGDEEQQPGQLGHIVVRETQWDDVIVKENAIWPMQRIMEVEIPELTEEQAERMRGLHFIQLIPIDTIGAKGDPVDVNLFVFVPDPELTAEGCGCSTSPTPRGALELWVMCLAAALVRGRRFFGRQVRCAR